MSSPEKTMLVVGAHHDDCEYAASGLILKAVSKGYRVVLVTLTGEHSSWAPTAGREKEVRAGLLKVAADMGVEKRFYNWGYHHLRYDDSGIQPLTELAVELKPQIALIHWPHDYWPDHEAAGRISSISRSTAGTSIPKPPGSQRASPESFSRTRLYAAFS